MKQKAGKGRTAIVTFVVLVVSLNTVSTIDTDLRGSSAALQDLIDEYRKFRVDESPELGTYYGLREYDDKIQEWTEAAFIRRRDKAIDFLNRAIALAISEFDDEDRMTHRIFKYTLTDYIDGFQFRKNSIYNNIAPLEEPVGSWLGLFRSMVYQNENDYDKAFKRLNLLDQYVNQRIVLLQETITRGSTLHEASLTGVVAKMDEQVVEDPTTSSFYKILFDRNRTSDISVSKWEELKVEGARIINESFVPAWAKFRDFLDQTYSKNTRPIEGAFSIPDGHRFYEASIKWHVSVAMTAEEVHQKGLEEVDRISANMEKEMEKYGFTGTIQQFINEVIKGDPNNFYTDPDVMLAAYQDIYDHAHSQMSKVLLNVPVTECKVTKYDNPDGPVGMYAPPTDSRPYGMFLANVFYPENVPKSDMPALTLHEAEPGHHTQIAYNLESDLPLFRRERTSEHTGAVPFAWQGYTAYTEGWGLYSESLGEEIGAYEENYSLFGRYSYEMWRATRLVVDSGIHAKGWTKEQAIDYIGTYTNFARPEIENEVNRYISWPGQACAYKIGELKIWELRRKAEETFGDKFDLRVFNDEVLRVGPVPLAILEEEINAWIDRNAVAAACSIHASLFGILILCVSNLIIM